MRLRTLAWLAGILILTPWLCASGSTGSSPATSAQSETQASRPERQKIDVSKLGPQVGERVPDFSLPDQFGKTQTLRSIMGPKGAMLVFNRSADW